MTDEMKEKIRDRMDFQIRHPKDDTVPEWFKRIVRTGSFPKDDITIETQPVGDEGPWTTAGIPIVENAPSFGYMSAEVRIPVADFRRLQEYIGTELLYPDTSPRDWWRVNDERVESIAAVLRGDEEPNEFYDGIPRPYFEVGSDRSLRSTQEGRHRTIAAERVGLDTIPATIVYLPGREGAGGPNP